MVQNKIADRLEPLPLGKLRLGGGIAEQMEKFFDRRVRSDYAKAVIYPETAEQFRLRNDDETAVGWWRGEFWGKWVISACRVARYENDDSLREFLHNAALDLISTADEDGYIGTYRRKDNYFAADPDETVKVIGWRSNWNWNLWCRKYTLWGLLECYMLCGDERILAAAEKSTAQLCDMLEANHTRPGETGTFNGLPSCSIMKPVLILYRLTGNRRWLDFALGIADDWERPDGRVPNLISNALAMKPIHEWYPESEKWAKAYEMLSCLDGLLELYRVTGVGKYLKTVENMYALLSENEQNVMFSVGFNDIFAHASEYQNSISEPCDVIHWMRICYELFRLTGEAKYMDSFERAYYNPFLAASFADGEWGARGVRSCGRHMVATGQAGMKYSHCCVNNMPRGYLNAAEAYVMVGGDGIYVNLYTDFECRVGGGTVKLGGSYLRDGRVKVSLDLPKAADVHLRIPAWSRRTVIDGEVVGCPQSYVVRRVGAGRSELSIEFDMAPELHQFHREPERFDVKDFRVGRFISGNDVPVGLMSFDRRSVLTYGALLLVRSKMVGCTEGEMFGSAPLDPRSECEIEPIESSAVRNAFRVRFATPSGVVVTHMCDYATGTNRWSADDAALFNLLI